MGLLSKRRGTTSTEGSTSPTVSPEKPLKEAKSRNARASFVETIVSKPGIRSQSSQGDLRRAGIVADGTPVAYDSTTAANHSRRGNFSLDEGALSARSNGSANANRRSIFSRGPQDDASQAGLSAGAFPPGVAAGIPRSVSLTAHQPVGEGSLSLAHLLPSTESEKDLRTPKPQTALLDPLGQSLSEVSMRVTDTLGNRVYAPVFEHSDIGTSSSSSGASSPAIGTAGDSFPTIQLERVPTNDSQPNTRLESGQNASDTTGATSLQPSAAEDLTRARSASASSSRSWRNASPIRPPAIKRKSSKINPGIAGALALSGMALAASAPGGAHTIVPVRQHSGSERQESGDTDLTGSSSQLVMLSRSSEEHSGYESPTPLSNYSPHDSPVYDNDLAVRAMTSIDALGDFEDVASQLGSGYALASAKRNADFHSVFKHIADDDFLIEDYGCALQREILVQGRLYISEHHLCFNANIFGWVTTLVIAFSDIISIEKRNTALVIPNAIHIATMNSRNTFASFLSRDMTYDLIVTLWRNQHPAVPTSAALPDTIVTDEEDEFGIGAIDDDQETGRKKRKGRKGRFKKLKSSSAAVSPVDEEETALAGTSITKGLTANGAGSGPRTSIGGGPPAKKAPEMHEPTNCNCLSAGGGGHFSNVVMDCTFPGSPEKLYNLIFTSGFMRDFLCNDMALSDLQISDWAPQKTGSNLLTRTYSYIKPLSAPIGPKTAKCILVDENLHVDFDNFVTTMTTTKTPDVPSGGSFSVKTKTCCMWAKNNSTRVLVTTAVEWTGRSFVKGIIDKQSIDGQKTLYIALEKSVRAYIAQHKSEFYEGGEAPEAEAAEAAEAEASAAHSRKASEASNGIGNGNAGDIQKPSEPLSFITEPIPQLKPICDFLTTLWDTGADVSKQMDWLSRKLLLALIIVSVACMLLWSSNRHATKALRRAPPNYSDRSAFVQEQIAIHTAVQSALRDYFHADGLPPTAGHVKVEATPKEEVEAIMKQLDALEYRLAKLRTSLSDLD